MHRTIQRSAILLLSVITTLLIVNLGTTHAYSTQPGPKQRNLRPITFKPIYGRYWGYLLASKQR